MEAHPKWHLPSHPPFCRCYFGVARAHDSPARLRGRARSNCCLRRWGALSRSCALRSFPIMADADGDLMDLESPKIASAWKPVEVVDGIGVVGGFLKRPMWVPVERWEGETFVKAGRRESWLCHAAAGKALGLNPLGRCQLFEDLAKLVQQGFEHAQGPPAVHPPWDAMAGFGLDGESPPEAISKNQKSKGRGKPEPQIVRLTLPPRLRGSGREEVRFLSGKLRSALGLLVHVDAVRWLIEVVRQQVQSAGVDFVPSETKLSEPFYATRDRSWVARARTPAGESVRKAMRIPLFEEDDVGRKRPLSEADFQNLKWQKLAEIKEWQSSVQNGDSEKQRRGRPSSSGSD